MFVLRFALLLAPMAFLLAQAPAPEKAAETAAPAVAPDKVILNIGETKITAGEYESFLTVLQPQQRAAAQGPQKRQFAEQFVRLKILAQEALRRKLDETDKVRHQMTFQRDNLLAGALFEQMAKNLKFEESAVRSYYEEHRAEHEEVKARHILVRQKGSPVPLAEGAKELTDEEALARANELKKRLTAGEEFALLAQAESDDKGTGAAGGDLGAFKRGQMVKAFEDAVFEAPVGEVSGPVKTPFGYHLLLVEKREAPSFEQMRSQIEEQMRPDAARKAVEEMRNSAAVTIDEAYFGPAQ